MNIQDIRQLKLQNYNEVKNGFCMKGQISRKVCSSKNCNYDGFLCQTQSCQCQLIHKKCWTIQIVEVIKRVRQKVVKPKPLIDFIQTGYQKIIDSLSLERDKIINMLKDNQQILGLEQVQKELLKWMMQEKIQAIQGNIIWKVIRSLQDESKFPIILQKMKQQITDMFQNINKVSNLISQKIKKVIKINLNLKSTQQQKIGFEQENELHQIGKQSKILAENYQISQLTALFQPNKISSFQILYRASDNNFFTWKFHQYCDNITDTLTIVRTQTGNIIAGYTPLTWKSVFGKEDINQSEKSFLYSFSTKDKFVYERNSGRAILNHINFGPVFGQGYDLFISDRADKEYSSFSRINSSFKNSKYVFDAKQTYQKVHGSSGHRFKISQWEVWKVSFKE